MGSFIDEKNKKMLKPPFQTNYNVL